jgi:hypothetical protein
MYHLKPAVKTAKLIGWVVGVVFGMHSASLAGTESSSMMTMTSAEVHEKFGHVDKNIQSVYPDFKGGFENAMSARNELLGKAYKGMAQQMKDAMATIRQIDNNGGYSSSSTSPKIDHIGFVNTTDLLCNFLLRFYDAKSLKIENKKMIIDDDVAWLFQKYGTAKSQAPFGLAEGRDYSRQGTKITVSDAKTCFIEILEWTNRNTEDYRNSLPVTVAEAETSAAVINHDNSGASKEECFPPCRAGFFCHNGNCISSCNPPCRPNEICKNGDCVPAPSSSSNQPASTEAASLNQGRKFHQHTGFYLSFNAGFANGSINTSFDGSSSLKSFDFGGSGPQFSFDIGGAVAENIILYAEIPAAAGLMSPSIKENDVTLNSAGANFTVNSEMVGLGVMYYLMPYDFLFTGAVGLAFNTVADNSDNSIDKKTFYSKNGFGCKIRAGKEWWVSRRWALGAVGFYQFSSVKSGDIFLIEGQTTTSLWGICFSATFN